MVEINLRCAGEIDLDSLEITQFDGARKLPGQWLGRFRAFWEPKMEALATEIARGKRKRRIEKKRITLLTRPCTLF